MNAISVKNISKSFKVYFDKGLYLKEKVLFRERNRHEIHDVLRDISFDVAKGEAIGLIGQNGCGKSTMLKLLSRIMYPDSGTISITGRVSSLIELGAGFHPDMSGRENIYTNAAIFGLSRTEIDQRLDDIIRFAELGEFIDSPVRIYSSGMYMRLAFAVAVNVDADVLLIDEILAVGDTGFQVKCFNKLREIKAKGTTIVIVSHSLGQIEQFCDRSYWIRDGKVYMQGAPRDVHPAYKQYMLNKTMEAAADENLNAQGKGENVETPPITKDQSDGNVPVVDEESSENSDRSERAENGWLLAVRAEATPGAATHYGTGKALLSNVHMFDSEGRETTSFKTGERITVEYDYHFYQDADHPCCGITIYRMDGVHCYGTNSELDHVEWVPKKDGKIRMAIDSIPLLTGEYMLDVAIAERGNFDCDYYKNAMRFNVYAQSEEVGILTLNHRWEFE